MSDSLVLALGIGIGFGAALESAGLGRSRTLVGQFYYYDFTVFKVMFSAIVTAMLGLFWLGRAGILSISTIYVPETYWAPQIVGGLIFGLGFALSGLCPGTSCVAFATGRMDGLATMFGLFIGVLVTGVCFPALSSFYFSTHAGIVTLPTATGLPYGVIVAVVTAAAVASFALIERHARA